MTDQLNRPVFWSNLLAWVAYGLCYILAHLPYRLLLAVGRGVGWLFKVLFKSRRAVIEKNIQTCFPGLGTEQQQVLICEFVKGMTLKAKEKLSQA